MDSNRPFGIHTIHDVIASPDIQSEGPLGTWGPAVPLPYDGNRLVAAWWVLTGKAYALRWPTTGELHTRLGLPVPKQKP